MQKIIGRGGMGVVWLAQDAYLESLVALKVLPDTLLHDSASLDSLKRETKLGLSLAHPHIVRIYDFQNDEHAAAISMEYVDGGNLSDLRVKKPSKVLNPSELVGWLEALFDGLDYAHNRRQIVHRDLKPRNLMLNSRGELKIADFGISRSISDSMTMLTGNLGSTGSPPYVSPQQWDGERPTPLDDIYSLGATLYELLTSKPPLLGVVDWQQVHHKIAPPMCQRRLDFGIKDADPIPTEWEETIAACLAKDPKDRPQTVRELKARMLIDGLRPVIPSTYEGEDIPQTEDDLNGRTIGEGPTLRIGQSEAPADDEDLDGGVTSRPTAHHSPAPESDTGGLTIPDRKPEPPIAPKVEVAKPKKIPVVVWLAAAAIVLLAALALFVIPPPVEVAKHDASSTTSRPTPSPPPPQPSAEQFGTLVVATHPSGASLLLDGEPPSSPPDTFTNVSLGTHELTATLDGYETISRQLNFDTTKALYEVLDFKRSQQWLRLQELVDRVKIFRNAPDKDGNSPDYLRRYLEACLGYLRHLYLKGSPPSPELPPEEVKQELDDIIKRLRENHAALTPSVERKRFEEYEDAIRRAEQLGSLQALLMLAENEKKRDEKIKLFKRAADEKSDPYAMMMLGIMNAAGEADIPGEPDYDKAYNLLERAAKGGIKEAAAFLWEVYLLLDRRTTRSESEQREAIDRLKELAAQGVHHAEVVLGQWTLRQAIATRDRSTSLTLYQEAADLFRKAKGPREWRACFYLGTLHEEGRLNEDRRPTQDDLNKAKALYQEGANNEDVACIFKLGQFLLEHPNDSRNGGERVQARSLIQKAADAGYKRAQDYLLNNPGLRSGRQ